MAQLSKNSVIEVYHSLHITIHYLEDKSRFIIKWLDHELSIVTFKQEMLAFLKTHIKYCPTQVLWDQTHFSLELLPIDYTWIEEDINKPCIQNGQLYTAFVVGKDLMAHLSVVGVFKSQRTSIQPRHFLTPNEALTWLDNPIRNYEQESENLDIKLIENEDSSTTILINNSTKNIDRGIHAISQFYTEKQFLKQNIQCYLTLTIREKKILLQLSAGKSITEIAQESFNSEFTIRTHWRNIKRKLSIKNFYEIEDYVRAFIL